MDWIQMVVTIVGVVISSGLIQFYFNRKDKLKEDAKKDNADTIKKEMKDHLTEVNSQWKIDYCDKNAQAIQTLREEVAVGLDERERRGTQRFEEHRLAIEKMNIEHQKDFQELKQAIQKLTENDTKIVDSLGKIADKQDVMANGIMGLSHDKLVFMTDRITERGAITLKEQATLTSIYEPYIKLEGNGDAKAGYKHVMGLKVVSDEEAKDMDTRLHSKNEKNRSEVKL